MMMTGKTSGSEVAVTSNTAGAGGGSFFGYQGIRSSLRRPSTWRFMGSYIGRVVSPLI